MNKRVPSPTVNTLIVFFVLVVPAIWLGVARHVWSSEMNLLWPVIVLAGLQAGVVAVFRPKTAAARMAIGVAVLPLLGLAITCAAVFCCPEGHPPLAALLWVVTSYGTVVASLLALVLLREASRGGETTAFVAAELVVLALVTPLGAALLPTGL